MLYPGIRGSGRRIAFWLSCIASSVVHILLIIALIQFPQLLQGGMLSRFRVIPMITRQPDAKSRRPGRQLEDRCGPQAPVQNAGALRPNSSKSFYTIGVKRGPERKHPPIRIRWGDEQKAALKENALPAPKIKQEPRTPRLSPPANESISTAPGSASETQSPAGKSTDTASGSPVTVRTESSAGKKDVINLPPPGSPAKSETAGNAPPRSVPEGINQPPGDLQSI